MQKNRDIFISYSNRNELWARWILSEIEAGSKFRCIVQFRDFYENFLLHMDEALKKSAYILAIHSEYYASSRNCAIEWQYGLANRNLILFRIDEQKPDGLLNGEIYADLHHGDYIYSLHSHIEKRTQMPGVFHNIGKEAGLVPWPGDPAYAAKKDEKLHYELELLNRLEEQGKITQDLRAKITAEAIRRHFGW